MTSPASSEFRTRVTRPWRVVFVLYALALEIGTHWPRLTFGPEVPASDKSIHVAAFAGLVVLLWRTRWPRRRWVAVGVVFVWSLVNELWQGLPILGRTVAVDDMVANAAGVVLGGAVLWALAPVGGRVNRRRLALHAHALDRLTASPRTWGALLAVGVAAGGLVTVSWLTQPAGRTAAVIVLVLAGGGVLIAAGLHVAWRRERRHIAAEHACFTCNARTGAGTHACQVCHATLTPGQWLDPPLPTTYRQLRLFRGPATLVVLVILAVTATILALPTIYGILLDQPAASGIAPRAARWLGSHTPLVRALDLTLALLLLAAATRLYRTRLAQFYDQAERCVRCGHDLRGTPVEDGVGRCAECGTPFVFLGVRPASSSTSPG